MKNWVLPTKSSLKNICSSEGRAFDSQDGKLVRFCPGGLRAPLRKAVRKGSIVRLLSLGLGCGLATGICMADVCAMDGDSAASVTVCVLDSGYSGESTGNSEKAVSGITISGWNYLEDSADISDEQGHGTDICTLIAGGAPEAEIIMLKCFDEERTFEGDAIVAALYAAVDDYQADVVNMSWTTDEENEELRTAVQYAAEKGAVMVASAGNLSLTTGLGSTVYPALWEEVIGVGGVDLDEEGNPVSSLWYLSGEAVYVCTRGDYEGGKGSSYAAARISGIVAAFLAENPEADAKTVRQMLRDAAWDLGENGYDPVYGWGYIKTEY